MTMQSDNGGGQSRLRLWIGKPVFWFVVALIIRLLYLLEQGGTSPLFYQPLLDEKEAVDSAINLLRGAETAEPYFKAPGYTWIMAAVMAVSGEAWPWTIRLLQHLCGAWLVAMVSAMAARLVNGAGQRVLAIAMAGALGTMYAPMIRLEQNLSLDFWAVFFQTAMLYVLMVAPQCRRVALTLLAAGALAAMAWVTRPTVTLILPFLAGWVFTVSLKRSSHKLALRNSIVFLMPVVMMAGGVGIRNYLVSKEAIAMPWQGGYSLYEANKAGANGRYLVQSGFVETEDANPTRQLAIEGYASALARATDGVATTSIRYKDVSAFWYDKTMDAIRAEPLEWVGLYGRKLLYMFSDKEIFNYEDFALQKSQSSILPWLPGRFGVVFPMALASLAGVGLLSRWRRQRHDLAWIYIVMMAGAIALYYASGRMRMPIALPLIALAGVGVTQFGSLGMVRRIGFVGLFVVGIVISWGDWFGVRSESMAHVDLARMSNAAWHRGKFVEALDYAMQADEISPDYPGTPRLKAQALYSLGRLQESAIEFQKSVEMLGDQSSMKNLQIVKEELKQR